MSLLVVADFDESDWACWLALLREALPREQIVRGLGAVSSDEIDVAIVANPVPGSLTGLTRLKLIQSLWAGMDKLLADATVPQDVPLARMVDPAMNRAMAESVLWAVLSTQRDFFAYLDQQRMGVWRQLPVRTADEISVAVLGQGQMGRAATQRLSDAGYRVIPWSRSISATKDAAAQGMRESLYNVIAQADVVVNLLPLTPSTRAIFDAPALARMKLDATLVNFARGAHVVEHDLLDALDRGRPLRAVLDVFAEEPLPRQHPYWAHPAVTVLPHVAAPTDPRSAALVVASNIRALREGRPISHLVDRSRGY